MWDIFDGQKSIQLTTEEIDQEWPVNIEYNMFPDDKKYRRITGDRVDANAMRKVQYYKEWQ
jgi:hypothetical protein